MFTLIIKRIVVIFMALTSFLNYSSSKEYGDYCDGFDFPQISAENQAAGTLRIMSFNIRCGDVNGVNVPDRIDIAVRKIKETMPDSLGIQEATSEWMKALDKSLSLYGWVGIEREEGGSPMKSGESCPIFYLKSRFTLEDSGNFWISDTPDVPSFGPGAGCKRICTWAKLKDRETGKTIVHVNTHYDHISEEARMQGALIVTAFIEKNFAGLPVVFTADMNTTEKGEAYAVMTENMNDARFAAEDCKTYGTFHGGKNPAGNPDYYIDFVLCSKEFEIEAYRTLTKGVDGRFVSDHFPIYADLTV
ncbi:MAG: endonuclease/exonuclease/phosphatase family protein [Clostridia bacterium]|nr:endonuclease/exonuclease/phosphatase family protein [Clostridia bacterium]